MLNKAIPTFIINLKIRTDRKNHILEEFTNRAEFDVTILEAVENKNGAVGLWKSILKCVEYGVAQGQDYILVCEDDHQFTEHYNKEYLYVCIEEAQQRNVDVLNGGVSWVCDILKISENLYYPLKFSGTQFIVIFKKFFSKLLLADFNETDSADYKMSWLSKNIYFVYPFLSVQKEFGYSDATTKNNGTNRVEELFRNTESNVAAIAQVYKHYNDIKYEPVTDIDYDSMTIPTYIIAQSESPSMMERIKSQFKSRDEFQTVIITPVKQSTEELALWLSIRSIVQIAIDSDDDLIIVCKDYHEFTAEYSKYALLKNIIEAHELGCDYLIGGTKRLDFVVPISSQRYWINIFSSAGLIVLYRKFFRKILDEPYDESINTDLKLSQMTSHKMVMYPFISKTSSFNLMEDGTNNTASGSFDHIFNQTKMKLDIINSLAVEHEAYCIKH